MGLKKDAKKAFTLLPEDELQVLRARWSERDEEGRTRGEALREQLTERVPAGAKAPRDLRGASLTNAKLRGIDLTRCDLTGADLTGADLTGARLAWATLTQAVLTHCTLDRCEFLGANLQGANLNEVHGERAAFGACDLSQASLFGADLPYATFGKSHLTGADLRTAKLVHARLLEADLSQASFAEADMRHADLTASDVRKAVFDGADLREGHLRGIRHFDQATWVGTDIREVDFCGAYLVRRHIMDENYLHEFRRRGGRYEVLYQVWRLTSDCGRSLLRWGLFISAIILLFSALYMFVDIDYGDHPTRLSPLYFSVVTVTTLGYGDAVPASTGAQILALLEVSTGYVALGGMLSIFANKMARRAE